MAIDPDGTMPKWLKKLLGYALGVIIAIGSIALTVATFGVGTAIAISVAGFAVGAAYGGLSAAASGQNVFLGMLTGGIAGIIMGNFAAVGAGLFVGGEILGGITISAAGGFAGGFFTETMNQINKYGRIVDTGAILKTSIEYGAVNVLSMFFGLFSCGDTVAELMIGSYIFNLLVGTISFTIDYIRNFKNKRKQNGLN